MNAEPVLTVPIWLDPATGEPVLGAEGLALLFGKPVAEVRAAAAEVGSLDTQEWVPSDWWPAGRRRSAEARAHGDSITMLDAVKYWARKEHDADRQADTRDDGDVR
jgi:hypothetical protein